jgi:peptidoglycan/LPS O-acetylase OafA/YrhL
MKQPELSISLNLIRYFIGSPIKQGQPIGNDRNVAVDVARAASMLYIVGYWHLLEYATPSPRPTNDLTFGLAILVLGLFSIVSGFTIGQKSISLTAKSLLWFYKQRFLRLYPPLMFAECLFVLLHISGRSGFFKCLTLSGMFFAPAPVTLWFVCLIAVFYAISPFLIALRTHLASYICANMFVIMLMLGCNDLTNNLDGRLFIYFPCFSAGIFIAARPVFLIRTVLILFLLAIASFVIVFYRSGEQIEYNLWATPWVFTASLGLFGFILNIGKNWRGSPFVSDLSFASLFMYLLHRPIYTVASHYIQQDSFGFKMSILIGLCLPLAGVIAWQAQKGYNSLLLKFENFSPRIAGKGGMK